MKKLAVLFFAFIVLTICNIPCFSQVNENHFGWDLTYSTALKTNKIGSKTFIRKWLAGDYQSPAQKWISEWQGEPIISSILVEYPAFHAAEHSTMWLIRTKNHAYYWEDVEGTKFSGLKKELKLSVYDNLLKQVFFWKQAKPNQPKHPQSIPGYLGFLSIYDRDKSRQILLSEEDFAVCKTKKCEGVKAGRLMLALKPVILKEGESDYKHKSEAEIVAMSPTQRVDEYFKERNFHNGDSIEKYTAGRDQGSMISEYILKDGVKVLPALAKIANRYQPDIQDNYELASEFFIALRLAESVNDRIVRIRTTEEGRLTIKVFEDVLNRMKKAGLADEENKSNNDYSRQLDTLRVLQGKSLSFTDEQIRDTLKEKHKLQISDEEMIRFSNYLTALDPTYPSRCEFISTDVCKESKEYYEAYLKFKAETEH